MRARAIWRIGCTVAIILIVECAVLALAALPVLAAWAWAIPGTARFNQAARLAAAALAIGPSYILFALGVLAWSAVAVRLTGGLTPEGREMRIADLGWDLLAWARAMTSAHVVRIFAGTVFRGSPIWTAYMRACGARIGRGVYVNTTFVSDYNLLEFGDGVVVGSDAHISGHTVERGVVKTGGVRLGRGVTVGLGSVIDIDVEAEDGCQIGALSLVPKHSRLERGAVYAGIPVHRLQ